MIMLKRTKKEEIEWQKVIAKASNSRAYAIKAYCYQCSAYNKAEVRKCPCKDCPLWRYRTGRTTK